MTTPPNPATLDPEEIRKLPFQPNLKYNGLTEDQVRAIDLDPTQVEESRLIANEARDEAFRAEGVALAVAALRAVNAGDVDSTARAAEALRAAGRPDAADLLTQAWQQEAAEARAIEAAEELDWLDADEYAARVAAQKEADLAASRAEVDSITEKLHATQAEELRRAFQEALGGHQLAPAVGERLVSKLSASGVLPSTEAEREAVIEETLRETAILRNAEKGLRDQIKSEWSIIRKEQSRAGKLITKADIAVAEKHYSEERFKQLADAKKIDTSTFAPTPSAEEESAALAEKYRAKQEKSDSFHRHVHAIGAKESRDRGEVLSADRAAFREAMQRAEESVRVGTVRTSLSPDNGAQENENGLPAGFVDEYGPGGYS